MIPTDSDYQEILAGEHEFEWKIQLGTEREFGNEYVVKAVGSSTSPPRIIRQMFSGGEPSVGNCIAAEFSITLMLKSYRIPRRSIIRPFFRAVPAEGEPSEWYQAGEFFVDSRNYDPITGTLRINCYDAMLKADGQGGSNYYDVTNISTWPASASSVVAEIAQIIGVEIDSRTSIQSGFMVDDPEDFTMREVLGYIAAAHAANWCITNEGKLRMIPLRGDNTTTIPLNLSAESLDVGPEYPSYTKIKLEKDSKTTYVSGIAVGLILTAEDPWATQAKADYMRDAVEHLSYQPFNATDAIVDPALELGDKISFISDEDVVSSYVWSIDMTCDEYSASTVGASGGDELNHEYPYIPITKRRQRRVEEEIEELEESVEETIEETVEEIAQEIVPAEVDSKLELTLIRAKEMNFSGWDNGNFYEILDNDVQINYTVLFDGLGRPILIVDGEHTCEIVW